MNPLYPLQGNFFYELLFFESPQIVNVSEYFIRSAQLFIGVVFALSALWEFFTQNRYRELILRTIFSLLVLSSYRPFLEKSLEVTFKISEKIVKDNDPHNYIVKGFRQAQKIASSKIKKREEDSLKSSHKFIGLWDKLKIMSKVIWSDTVSVITWSLVFCTFFMLKVIYSSMLGLLYVFVPLQALLFIFAPTAQAFGGAFKTYLSLILTPMVVAVLLIILGNNLDSVSDLSQYTLTETLEGLIQILLTGILLLFSPSIASGLVSKVGSIVIGGKISQILSSAVMTAGLGSLVKETLTLPKRMYRGSYRKGEELTKKLIKGSKPSSSQVLPAFPKKKVSTQKKSSPVKTPTEKKTEQKARNLIKDSQSGNIDLKKYTLKEKSKAIEIAQKNPRSNFIRRNIYHALMSEMFSQVQNYPKEKIQNSSKAPSKTQNKKEVTSKNIIKKPSKKLTKKKQPPKIKRRLNNASLSKTKKQSSKS